MGTYKGNAGHLMQHWTLCELLDIAGKNDRQGLNFIDAHAMAPMARRRDPKPGYSGPRFDRARRNLPGGSVYEQAWHNLDPNGVGYPNSAAFVREVWEGQVSMLLCETDPATSAALRTWVQDHAGVKIAEGDWRCRFRAGLPSLPSGSLTLVSFDPYMYNSRRRFDDPKKRKKGNLYPDDIERALDKMSSLEGGVLVQISTYDTNDTNPQGAVISSVNSILAAGKFTLCAVVRYDGKMMSLVYSRNVSWWAELANLPDRFTEWLNGIDR